MNDIVLDLYEKCLEDVSSGKNINYELISNAKKDILNAITKAKILGLPYNKLISLSNRVDTLKEILKKTNE